MPLPFDRWNAQITRLADLEELQGDWRAQAEARDEVRRRVRVALRECRAPRARWSSQRSRAVRLSRAGGGPRQVCRLTPRAHRTRGRACARRWSGCCGRRRSEVQGRARLRLSQQLLPLTRCVEHHASTADGGLEQTTAAAAGTAAAAPACCLWAAELCRQLHQSGKAAGAQNRLAHRLVRRASQRLGG